MRHIGVVFAALFLTLSAFTSAQEDEVAHKEFDQTIRQLDDESVTIDDNEDDDGLPDSIPVDAPDTDDGDFRGRKCNALYVYLKGCPNAYRVFGKMGLLDVDLGTKSVVGGFPIQVLPHGSNSKLFWRDSAKRYFLYVRLDHLLKVGLLPNTRSLFHVGRNRLLKVSNVVNGKRKYYKFFADITSCASDFLFKLGNQGLPVYVKRFVQLERLFSYCLRFFFI